MDFLERVKRELRDLPIIAEDLGVITPDVVAMRDKFNLPGMRIIQFAFTGDPREPFLPHNHVKHAVVYTGTHDNDTARSWYERVPEREKSFYRRYLDRDGSRVAWDMIRAAWGSIAVYALAPMQDFLNLGNEARMNYPGNPSGNWTWRMVDSTLSENLQSAIREINFLYDRENVQPEEQSQEPGVNAADEFSFSGS
jgi:4-alpha-glucanotransferase